MDKTRGIICTNRHVVTPGVWQQTTHQQQSTSSGISINSATQDHSSSRVPSTAVLEAAVDIWQPG